MSISVRKLDPEVGVKLLESALPQLPENVASTAFVCVGDTIDTESQEGFLRGHGTQVVDSKLVATLCGVVERVNKLIYVRPLRSRYSAEVGDVVVGRITEIAGKRWKVDLNSRQEAGLQLSAVNLPGGVQRRRTAEDELNMRSVFREGDLISAEVQALHGDGSIALHTRSAKYGKLTGGQMVSVAPNFVKRQKQHFHTIKDAGVDLILGLNGMLWVAQTSNPAQEVAQPLDTDGDVEDAVALNLTVPTVEERTQCCRVANCVRALAKLCLSIYPSVIMEIYKVSLQNNVALKDMLEIPFLTLVAEAEANRRQAETS